TVSARGHRPVRKDLWGRAALGGTPERPGEVRLSSGADVRVLVLDGDGKTPAAGVRVTGACGWGFPTGVGADWKILRSAFASMGEAVTDADGQATLSPASAPSHVTLLAEAPGRVGATAF